MFFFRQLQAAIVAAAFVLAPSAFGQSLVPVQALEELTVGLSADSSFTAIALSPSDPAVAYLAGADGWVYQSDDFGASWSPRGLAPGRTMFYGSARHRPTRLLSRVQIRRSRLAPNPSTVFNFSNSQTVQLYFDGLPSSLSQLRADRVIRRVFDGGLGTTSQSMPNAQPRLYNHLRLSQGWYTASAPGMHADVIDHDRARAGVNWLAVHPTRPDECFAATEDGLFKTSDAGASWVRVYWAAQPERRDIVHVAYSPHDPGRVLAATRAGLLVSLDGQEFAPATDPRFATASTRHVLFDPRDADQEILVTGRVYGRSIAGNRASHLDWQSIVISDAREALFDPADPNTIVVRADAGIWTSHDGGRTFERAGGATFIGAEVTSIAVSSSGRHFAATTDRDVWESLDGGDTWRSVAFGSQDSRMVRVVFDPHEPGSMWLLGARRVVRVSSREPTIHSEQAQQLFVRWMETQPSLEDAIDAAVGQVRHRREDLNRYARRAALSGFLPYVSAGFRTRTTSAEASIDARFAGIDGDFFEDVFQNRYRTPDTAFMVVAEWGGLHPTRLNPVERARSVQAWSDSVHRRERTLTDRTGRLYSERARLVVQELNDSVREPRVVEMRALRIQELTSHLAHLTGGLIQAPQ